MELGFPGGDFNDVGGVSKRKTPAAITAAARIDCQRVSVFCLGLFSLILPVLIRFFYKQLKQMSSGLRLFRMSVLTT
jgi:hypothetical protein